MNHPVFVAALFLAWAGGVGRRVWVWAESSPGPGLGWNLSRDLVYGNAVGEGLEGERCSHSPKVLGKGKRGSRAFLAVNDFLYCLILCIIAQASQLLPCFPSPHSSQSAPFNSKSDLNIP